MYENAPRNRPVPPVYFLVTLLLSVGLHYLLPVVRVLHPPWTFSGVMFVVIGLTMAIVSAGAFTRAGTPVRPFEETTTLVVTGFYRYTRNPMYLGMVFVLLGTDLLLGTLSPFLLLPVFVWLIRQHFVRHEEIALEAEFGDEYRQLKRRVRRWL